MSSLKNIFVIIPARGGSKGVPGKNIMDFCGKPLVAWSIEQARTAALVTDVYVSSDDEKILEIAKRYGASLIRRPAEHATDEAGLEEVFCHAIKVIKEQQEKSVDILVCLQPTSPLRRDDDIDDAIRYYQQEQADSLFSASRMIDACMWKNDGGRWTSVTYDYTNRGRRQDRDPLFLENGSIYIFMPSILERYRNRLGGKIAMYEMPVWTSFEIDHEDDIPLCEMNMKKYLLLP